MYQPSYSCSLDAAPCDLAPCTLHPLGCICLSVMGFINNRDGVTIVALKPVPLEPYPRPLNKRLTNLQILTTMCVCVFPPPTVEDLVLVAPPAAILDLD
jgi:hypothetical protein